MSDELVILIAVAGIVGALFLTGYIINRPLVRRLKERAEASRS